MEPIIKQLIKQKTHCYFISPHLDDAVLSAGELILKLEKHLPVTIVNVFTEAGEKPYTLSEQAFLKQCKYTDAKKLYRDRRDEDARAFKTISLSKYNLGYIDALWRNRKTLSILTKLFSRIPALQRVYPTYRFHIVSGKISSSDKAMMDNIAKDLKKIVSKTKNYAIFCPIGIGQHVDHLIIREICKSAFANVFFWYDQPYDVREKNTLVPTVGTDSNVYFLKTGNNKKEILKKYTSQIGALFPGGIIPTMEERYYTTLTH